MKLELTNDQHQWVDQWLQLWGAWCQTGKIDKAMINMINQRNVGALCA